MAEASYQGSGEGISSSAPATQASQVSSFNRILQTAVQGTVGVIQQLRQPASVYQPALAGNYAGGSQGASQQEQGGTPSWTYIAFGIAGGLVLVAGVMALRK